jgi:hypothetical protein
MTDEVIGNEPGLGIVLKSPQFYISHLHYSKSNQMSELKQKL